MNLPAMPTAAGILQAGIDHLAERAVTYDKPQGERSVGMLVAMFNVLVAEKLKVPLSEEDGWNFMELLKLVRSKQGDYKADSFEDRAAYAALAAEAAYRERVLQPALEGLAGQPGRNKFAPDLAAIGTRIEIGPDVRFDQSGRREVIDQNGNTGEHYLPDGLTWAIAPDEAVALVSGNHSDGPSLYVWVPATDRDVIGKVAITFGGQLAGSRQSCALGTPGNVWEIVAIRPKQAAVA